MHPQHRAGIVYSRGLRRCLIIFAPHTLILDRRTGTCRAPSLQLVWQRSKNFTSGAAIPFTPSSPLMPEGCLPQPSQEVAAPGGGHTGWEGQNTKFPGMGTKASTTSTATSGRCFAIPWTDIQPNGCFGHTEFSTVASMVDPGGGPRSELHGTGPCPVMATHKLWV